MREISITNDIIPVGQIKTYLAKYLKQVNENKNSLIITQNGKPAGVLISPDEFDQLREIKSFIESISKGLSDSEKGEKYSSGEIKKMKLLKNYDI